MKCTHRTAPHRTTPQRNATPGQIKPRSLLTLFAICQMSDLTHVAAKIIYANEFSLATTLDFGQKSSTDVGDCVENN